VVELGGETRSVPAAALDTVVVPSLSVTVAALVVSHVRSKPPPGDAAESRLQVGVGVAGVVGERVSDL
jgi:hypothetical protein